MGHSPWGHKESDMTERLSLHLGVHHKNFRATKGGKTTCLGQPSHLKTMDTCGPESVRGAPGRSQWIPPSRTSMIS